jgi:Tol biopolymer transport system component
LLALLIAVPAASAATVNVTDGIPGDDFAFTWSPDSSTLAFLNETKVDPNDTGPFPELRHAIMSRRVDGTALRTLVADTATLGVFDWPMWSPNGTKIAYDTQRKDNFDSDVWVMNADGSGQTNLTTDPSNTDSSFNTDRLPSWSPDGQRIAFDSTRSKDPVAPDDIWVMNADGTGATDLTGSSSDNETFATFSPDGTKIAYGANQNLYVINADGSNRTLLSRGDCPCTWSPDSSKVLFSTTLPGTSDNEVYVVDADGTNRQDLTNNAANDFAGGPGTWVGGKIVFSSNRDGGYDVYSMNADGSGVTRLTVGGRDDESVQLSPDGQSVAFISNRCGSSFGVFVTSASGETDSKGPCPSGSADTDGDGIPDAIDPSPTTPSTGFDDHAGTSGSLVATGGLQVTLSDAPAPDGIRVVVGAGTGQITLRMCPGNFTVRLSAGSDAVLTCGSVTAKVTKGTAQVVLATDLSVVTIPAGVTAKVSNNPDGTYTVQNLGGGSVTVTTDGTTSTVSAGATRQVAAVTPAGLCHLTQQYVKSSAKYKALSAKQRATIDATLDAVCKGIAVIVPKLSPAKKAAAIDAYKKAVADLAKSGWLTQTQAATLVSLTSQL